MQITDTGALRITWTFMDKPNEVSHAISLDEGRFLCVVADNKQGNYEWVLVENFKTIMHSDNGYGNPERALMHGLNACDTENYL